MKYKLLKDLLKLKSGYEYPANDKGLIYLFNDWIDPSLYQDWFEPVIERWRTEINNYYFIVSHSLEPNMIMDTHLPEHDFQFNTGNYFKQMKQAEEASRRIKKVLMDYHKEIGE